MKITVFENDIKIPDNTRTKLIGSKINIRPYSVYETGKYEGMAVIYDSFSPEYIEYLCAKALDLPAVIGYSDRLQIREIHPSETGQYQKLIEECSSGLTDRSMLGLSEKEFHERHMAYIKYHYNFYGFGLWGLYLKGEPQSLIGLAGISGSDHTISYCISRNLREKGYAYEACCFVLSYLSEEYGINDISAIIRRENTASINLAEKLKIRVEII